MSSRANAALVSTHNINTINTSAGHIPRLSYSSLEPAQSTPPQKTAHLRHKQHASCSAGGSSMPQGSDKSRGSQLIGGFCSAHSALRDCTYLSYTLSSGRIMLFLTWDVFGSRVLLHLAPEAVSSCTHHTVFEILRGFSPPKTHHLPGRCSNGLFPVWTHIAKGCAITTLICAVGRGDAGLTRGIMIIITMKYDIKIASSLSPSVKKEGKPMVTLVPE